MSAALHVAWMGLLVFAAAALLVYGAATGLLFWLQGRLIYPPEHMRRGPTAHEAA